MNDAQLKILTIEGGAWRDEDLDGYLVPGETSSQRGQNVELDSYGLAARAGLIV